MSGWRPRRPAARCMPSHQPRTQAVLALDIRTAFKGPNLTNCNTTRSTSRASQHADSPVLWPLRQLPASVADMTWVELYVRSQWFSPRECRSGIGRGSASLPLHHESSGWCSGSADAGDAPGAAPPPPHRSSCSSITPCITPARLPNSDCQHP